MLYFLYSLLAVLILMVMITIHELGHYLAGKMLKFKINEFAIGFGPKLFSKKNKKTGEVFSIRAIPLGGFCAFEGEAEEETPDAKTEVFAETEKTEAAKETNTQANPQLKRFNDQKPWKRIIVLLAGGVFNLLSAIIFSFIFILAVGLEKPPVVAQLYVNAETGVAYNQEFQVGDRIIEVAGKKLTLMYTGNDAFAEYAVGDEVIIKVERQGESEPVKITVVKQKIDYIDAEGAEQTYDGFGYVPEQTRDNSFLAAVKYSVPYMGKMSWMVLSILGKLVTGKAPLDTFSGPIGTVTGIAKVSIMNWRNILLLLPLIAANLGIFNLLPIPALDGSKIIFCIIEWIRKKPVNRNVENAIHMAGMLLLLGFIVLLEIMGALNACGL